jgi:hypothetical protein
MTGAVDRVAALSGCKAASGSGDLICHLWRHAGDPTSSHWDADRNLWWQTDDEHVAMVAANREAAEAHDTAQHARIAELEQLAAGILASYHRGSDGYRGRVGQVQIAKWNATLRGHSGGAPR